MVEKCFVSGHLTQSEASNCPGECHFVMAHQTNVLLRTFGQVFPPDQRVTISRISSHTDIVDNSRGKSTVLLTYHLAHESYTELERKAGGGQEES